MKNWRHDIIPYRPDLRLRARKLRLESTKAEVLLWIELKQLQEPVKFRRQVPMLDFIVDFYCPELKFVIELDGESHYLDGAKSYDDHREKQLEKYGVTFLRFENDEVYHAMEWVLERIVERVVELRGSG
jgi:very-short-patch-repair endonuclease